jgi:hypothetical protein
MSILNKLTWYNFTMQVAGQFINTIDSYAVIKNVFIEKDRLIVKNEGNTSSLSPIFTWTFCTDDTEKNPRLCWIGNASFSHTRSLRNVQVSKAEEIYHYDRHGDSIIVISLSLTACAVWLIFTVQPYNWWSDHYNSVSLCSWSREENAALFNCGTFHWKTIQPLVIQRKKEMFGHCLKIGKKI